MALRRAAGLFLILVLAPIVADAAPQLELGSMRKGASVVVVTVDGLHIAGTVRSISASGVTLDMAGGPMSIAFGRIERVAERDSIRNGLLMGLAIGAAAGLTWGLLVDRLCADLGGNCSGAVALLTGTGAAAGTALGAGIDSLRYRTIFDANPRPPGELVPEIAGDRGFARSKASSVRANGPPSARAALSIRHSTSGWGLELEATRSLRSAARLYTCTDPTIAGCGEAREGMRELTTGAIKAQYFFRRARVQPYVSGGLMIYRLSAWRSDLHRPRDVPFIVETLSGRRGTGWVVAAGARIEGASRLSVRSDLTYNGTDGWEQFRGSVGLGFHW